MEKFKRNHLKKISNSFIPSRSPFEKVRSFSVWNGRELPRGGLPKLTKNDTIKDSLYESQPSEKAIMNSGSSGKDGMGFDSDLESPRSFQQPQNSSKKTVNKSKD